MNLRRLEMLMKIIQLGNMSRAAEELGFTQSALTQAMNALEKEFGVQLIVRNRNGIHLSPEGEELWPSIVAAYNALKTLNVESERVRNGVTKTLRIGSFVSVAASWLPSILNEYTKKYPDVRYSLLVGTRDMNDWLLRGEVDLALMDDLRGNYFRFYPLEKDSFYGIFPENMAPEDMESISAEEILKYPFINAIQHGVSAVFPQIPANAIDFDSDDDETLLKMIQEGMGVTVMSELCIANLPKGIKVVPILPKVTRTMGVAVPNTPTEETMDFVRFLQNYFANK